MWKTVGFPGSSGVTLLYVRMVTSIWCKRGSSKGQENPERLPFPEIINKVDYLEQERVAKTKTKTKQVGLHHDNH